MMYDQSKMGNTIFGVVLGVVLYNTKLVPSLWAFLNHLNFKNLRGLGGMIANRKKVQNIQKANLN